MSYILEALKRAEAERGRGVVPTLQSQSATAPAEAAQKRPATPYLLAGAAALVLLVLGAMAARWWSQPAAPAVALAPAPAPAPVVAQPPAPKVVPAEPGFLPPPPAPQTAPPQANPQRVEPRTAAPVPAAVPAPMAASPKPVQAPAATPAASAPAPALADLPDSFRRELPPLKIAGSMYSDTPSARMLILNGIVYHEGDVLSPGLQLESIGTRRATLSYKGQRFSLDY